MVLTVSQARVLGSLLEKEISTPEYYPLTLNALLAACNQKSSRDPIMTLQEDDVRSALHALQNIELVAAVRDGRVPRFENRARTVLNLKRDETALLCLLLLRGPQTAGELRGRAERLFAFEDIPQVVGTLQRLIERENPVVTLQVRQAGSKEVRYCHTLHPVPAAMEPGDTVTTKESPSTQSLLSRISALEDDMRRVLHHLQCMGMDISSDTDSPGLKDDETPSAHGA